MMTKLSISQLSRILFWFTFCVLTFLFLAPQQYLAPEVFDWWDKLQHSLAFGVLAAFGLVAFGSTQKRVSSVVIALALYGALIEVLQSLSGWRYGEFRDWLADLLGIVIAWVIFAYIQKNPRISTFIKNT